MSIYKVLAVPTASTNHNYSIKLFTVEDID